MLIKETKLDHFTKTPINSLLLGFALKFIYQNKIITHIYLLESHVYNKLEIFQANKI